MQLIPCSEAREGQCLAQEVRDSRGRILLSRGQRLTTSALARLHRFRIEAIYIRDGIGDAAGELLKPELRQKCQEILSDSFGCAGQEAAKKRLTLDPHAIEAAMNSLINALLSQQNPIITLLDVSTSSDRLMQHSVNATVLAISLAIDLKIPSGMLNHLAAAMMFHDIGMTYLPEALTEKASTFTQDEIKMMREHVRLGVEHLVRGRAVSDISANIILRHHEAMDGSGYPNGVGADKLTTLARIACVAEVYDALTSPRPYAPAAMPDVALTFILNHTDKLFAREVVLALCRRVALYPTGTAVQLNTGESGIVAGTAPTAPTRPLVALHCDHRGRKLPAPQVLDLRQERTRFVVRSAASLQLIQKETGTLPAPRPVAAWQAHVC